VLRHDTQNDLSQGANFSFSAGKSFAPASHVGCGSTWSAEETDDPLNADRRNFYKVEKFSF
jgi:hypothetical protein